MAFTNMLVKLPNTGVLPMDMMPVSLSNLSALVESSTLYVDVVRGTDATNSGVFNQPAKTLDYALNILGGSKKWIKLAPGTYPITTTITNVGVTEVVIEGSSPKTTIISGTFAFNNAQDLYLEFINVNISGTLQQLAVRNITVNLREGTILQNPVYRATPSSTDSVLTVHRSADSSNTLGVAASALNYVYRLNDSATNIWYVPATPELWDPVIPSNTAQAIDILAAGAIIPVGMVSVGDLEGATNAIYAKIASLSSFTNTTIVGKLTTTNIVLHVNGAASYDMVCLPPTSILFRAMNASGTNALYLPLPTMP
jgi:hypothetical protein